jgi:tetrahydromethanopterin S-methyltransferase subunit G
MPNSGSIMREEKLKQLKADCDSCGKAIHEMCGQHSTDRKEFGKVLVRIDSLEDRLNKMQADVQANTIVLNSVLVMQEHIKLVDKRLADLEGTRDSTFDRIETKIDTLLKRE